MKIGLIGAQGRVGKQICSLVEGNTNVSINTVCEHKDIGKKLLEYPYLNLSRASVESLSDCDVIIDFSTPASTMHSLDIAKQINKPIVIGVTGFSEQEELLIKEHSQNIAIFKSSNMSIGVHIVDKVIKDITKSLLSSDYDIEIIEEHHRNKVDAPSGTAYKFAQTIADVYQQPLSNMIDNNRFSNNAYNRENKIGMSSVRGGNIIGNHSVKFISNDEIIEVKHSACSRMLFALGAIKAAQWLINQKHGLYGMSDLSIS